MGLPGTLLMTHSPLLKAPIHHELLQPLFLQLALLALLFHPLTLLATLPFQERKLLGKGLRVDLFLHAP